METVTQERQPTIESNKTMSTAIRIILLLLLIGQNSFGQIDSSRAQIPSVSYLKGSGGLIIGGHFIGKTTAGEIGYIKSKVTKIRDYRQDIRDSAEKLPFYDTQPYSAISLASEFFLNGKNQLCVGPKIGFDYNLLILHARINMTYYSDFGNIQDLRISPAAGLSLGLVNILYNFNYPLLKTRFENIATNRISLIIYLAKKQ